MHNHLVRITIFECFSSTSKALLSSNVHIFSFRLFVQELLKYEGQLNLLQELEEWTVPKFPVTGWL